MALLLLILMCKRTNTSGSHLVSGKEKNPGLSLQHIFSLAYLFFRPLFLLLQLFPMLWKDSLLLNPNNLIGATQLFL